INPASSSAISTAVQSDNSLGIPVVSLDRAAENGEEETVVALDKVRGGQMAADFIVGQLDNGAKVAEREGDPGA
ncbi:substrate-binding domain-containing protein, partial [Bacillus licheniformis]